MRNNSNAKRIINGHIGHDEIWRYQTSAEQLLELIEKNKNEQLNGSKENKQTM